MERKPGQCGQSVGRVATSLAGEVDVDDLTAAHGACGIAKLKRRALATAVAAFVALYVGIEVEIDGDEIDLGDRHEFAEFAAGSNS